MCCFRNISALQKSFKSSERTFFAEYWFTMVPAASSGSSAFDRVPWVFTAVVFITHSICCVLKVDVHLHPRFHISSDGFCSAVEPCSFSLAWKEVCWSCFHDAPVMLLQLCHHHKVTTSFFLYFHFISKNKSWNCYSHTTPNNETMRLVYKCFSSETSNYIQLIRTSAKLVRHRIYLVKEKKKRSFGWTYAQMFFCCCQV